MALIEKETLLKGLWDLVVVGVSGAVCVGGSYFAVSHALAKIPVPAGGPVASAGTAPAAGVVVAPPVSVGEPGIESPAPVLEEHEAEPKKDGKKKKKGGHGEGEKSSKEGLAYPLRTTVVNLAADSNHRFAKVSITLEVDSKETAEDLKNVDHQIYDCLIDTLGNVRAQDIGSDAGKDMLKETLRQKMNKFLPEGEITNVYMTELLVQ